MGKDRVVFEQFMQMGGPAAFAIVGTLAALGAVVILSRLINARVRDDAFQREIKRIEMAAQGKLIEAPRNRKAKSREDDE